ncbi:MAG: 3-deoxy-manno-octulosonate cytidylyltransferase [Opitutales bacterium]
MSKTTAIIVPARLGSTRFPRKLLHPVEGKPVVLWTAERIRAVAPEWPLYFAVDDAELEDCLGRAGYRTVMTRPDHQSGTDRIAEANARVGAAAVINVQGDEPLVTGGQIRSLAAGLASGAAMATLAVRFERPEDFANPNQVKVVRDRSGNALYFSRSPVPFARDCAGRVDAAWLAAHPVYRHLGLYAYSADFLAAFTNLEPGTLENIEKLEQLRAMEHGYRIHVGITDQPTVGIDTPEDIPVFEAALKVASARQADDRQRSVASVRKADDRRNGA